MSNKQPDDRPKTNYQQAIYSCHMPAQPNCPITLICTQRTHDDVGMRISSDLTRSSGDLDTPRPRPLDSALGQETSYAEAEVKVILTGGQVYVFRSPELFVLTLETKDALTFRHFVLM